MSLPLEDVARRVNWHREPDQLLADVDRFLAEVMARGNTEDVLAVQAHFTKHQLKQAYLASPPGLFSRRAWAYWGLMLLGNAAYPMPERFPGSGRFDWRRAT